MDQIQILDQCKSTLSKHLNKWSQNPKIKLIEKCSTFVSFLRSLLKNISPLAATNHQWISVRSKPAIHTKPGLSVRVDGPFQAQPLLSPANRPWSRQCPVRQTTSGVCWPLNRTTGPQTTDQGPQTTAHGRPPPDDNRSSRQVRVAP